jgi:hypothetical protein
MSHVEAINWIEGNLDWNIHSLPEAAILVMIKGYRPPFTNAIDPLDAIMFSTIKVVLEFGHRS